jgi:hypothetical protein
VLVLFADRNTWSRVQKARNRGVETARWQRREEEHVPELRKERTLSKNVPGETVRPTPERITEACARARAFRNTMGAHGWEWLSVLLAASARVAMSDELKTIAHLLRAQDNRSTADPMFVVQKSVREYGFDSAYTDKYVWMSHANDGHIARGKLRKRLEAGDASGACATYEKVYFKSKWRTVQWFFTEEAANDYITENTHNLGKCRVYVTSLNRNQEMRLIRDYLISLPE